MADLCCDCDRFAQEPGKERSGACFFQFVPNVRTTLDVNAYVAVRTYDPACRFFAPKGTIKRHEPERLGN